MNIISIIEKKRDGFVLTKEEIKYFIEGYCNHTIMDYQASALLMAICIHGMNKEETLYLTKAMLDSGVSLDLSDIAGVKVDKHSTGGVGDKTSLVLGPMLACAGLEFAKMSGRGLGHTGGTLDKLESMKGFTISLTTEQFIAQVKDIHIAIIGQNESFVPADKKLYALRDVTGTIPSIPLIASSIMSKKLAAGAEVILLDVKYGDGAFMPTKESAIELAKVMIEIGEGMQRRVRAEITNMNEPLGNAIGNSLEVKEAIETLKGNGPKDLRALCIHSASELLLMSHVYNTRSEAVKAMETCLDKKEAYSYFLKMVKAQGGYVENENVIFKDTPVYVKDVFSNKEGYISSIKTKQLGLISCEIGAGRMRKEDDINPNAGLYIYKKTAEYIKENELLCTIYSDREVDDYICNKVLDCFEIRDEKIEKEPLIYKVM